MGVEDVVVSGGDWLETNFALLYFLVGKIGFEDPEHHTLEGVSGLDLLDFEFIVELYQLNQVYMGFWDQILKIYRKPLVLIR